MKWFKPLHIIQVKRLDYYIKTLKDGLIINRYKQKINNVMRSNIYLPWYSYWIVKKYILCYNIVWIILSSSLSIKPIYL